jgi:hypothetical protein
MDFRHGSLLEITGSRTGGRRECVRPEQRAAVKDLFLMLVPESPRSNDDASGAIDNYWRR